MLTIADVQMAQDVFEAHYSYLHNTNDLCLTKDAEGNYVSYITQDKWKEWRTAWMACAAFAGGIAGVHS